MLRRLFESVLVRPRDVVPSHDGFEVVGVFNPGVVEVGDEVVLLLRVAERPAENRPGWTGLPRWQPDGGLTVDWMDQRDLEPVDSRVVRVRREGTVRLTSVSHLLVARSRDGRAIESVSDARFVPETELECLGVEDPRITPIGDRYYFSYVAVSAHGPATALASTGDFRSFERHGVIFCPENKDVVIFPRLIGGRHVALHRPNGATRFASPGMWVAESSDLLHWGRHRPLDVGSPAWSSERVGAGPPPLRTGEGWLEVYHGSRRPARPGAVGMYSAGVLLLDLDDPGRVLRTAPAPILEPTVDHERRGFVPNVVFPTGIVERGENLLIYYGGADTVTAVVEVSRHELMAGLEDREESGREVGSDDTSDP